MGSHDLTLLTEARAAGLEVRLEAGRLVVRGPRSGADLAHRVLARKREVLIALAGEDAEVAWRLTALRPCVPSRGPIPFLAARPVPPVAGRCLSCGDPLVEGRLVRCRPCDAATWIVLHQVREGISEDKPDDLNTERC
ncbi:MAG: hypothetical protein M3R02_14165 [Chloroflexota bacterium]|nr:hypothetical protein [Chloroflexota bacterium]